MRKMILFFLLCFSAGVAIAQPNTIQLISRSPITVGLAACIPIAPCDNTAASPAMPVGIVTNSVLNPNGKTYTITIQTNGIILAPIPFGENCTTGDLVGDLTGTGNLADLGPPATVLASSPIGFVGICIGDNAALTEMELVIQPGYVYGPNPNGTNN
jgi:hypothetical protein